MKISSTAILGWVQTVRTIVAETNGFNLIRNYKQLVSYAGYDVIQKKSGTSFRGKARYQKRGILT